VLIPRKSVDSPALVIELKYDKSVDTAIDQIKRRHYTAKVQEYAGHDLLLVGICYDRETKQHTCRIEPFTKE
jgi:Uma2 family endonuclease